MRPVDWFIVIVYATATLALGWYFGQRQKDTKEYFTNLLGCNKPVKWLRVNDDGDITRVVTRYTKEHYGVS